MNFWLLKTEPNDYSWEDMKKDKITKWDGVRNFEARNNLNKMLLNDLCFFYHTGKEKSILGMVKVIKTYYIDPQNPKFGMVDVKYYKSCKKILSLEEIKNISQLKNMIILKRTRLSVVPVTHVEAKFIILKTQLDIDI